MNISNQTTKKFKNILSLLDIGGIPSFRKKENY